MDEEVDETRPLHRRTGAPEVNERESSSITPEANMALLQILGSENDRSSGAQLDNLFDLQDGGGDDLWERMHTLEGFDFGLGDLDVQNPAELLFEDAYIEKLNEEQGKEDEIEAEEEIEDEEEEDEDDVESIQQVSVTSDTLRKHKIEDGLTIEGKVIPVLSVPETTPLKVFERIAILTILNNLYLQLGILGRAFPGDYTDAKEEDFLSLDERFKKQIEEEGEKELIPQLEGFKNPFIVDPTTVGTPEDRLAVKIQKDRAFLQEVIRLTRDEVAHKNTFSILKQNVIKEQYRQNEAGTLEDRYNETKSAVLEMKKKIEDYKKRIQEDKETRAELIATLKDNLCQVKLKGKRDANYTKVWHNAYNSHINEVKQNEVFLQHLKLKSLKLDIKRDRFVHKNLHQWSEVMVINYQKKIEYWKNKLKEDSDKLNKLMKAKQEVINRQDGLISELTSGIEAKRLELAPWDEEQEKARSDKAEALRLYYSARKIQRWWRQYMVRNNLYKPKVKGADKKGKKKGKKA